ncbi:MAG: hypothetical protein AAB426_06590, partial [Myxococcota bacterium]
MTTPIGNKPPDDARLRAQARVVPPITPVEGTTLSDLLAQQTAPRVSVASSSQTHTEAALPQKARKGLHVARPTAVGQAVDPHMVAA